MDELKNVIELHKIHILGVTETWLDDTIGDGEVTLPDYRIFRRDRSGKVGGGVGVIVYITVFQCVFFQLSIRT